MGGMERFALLCGEGIAESGCVNWGGEGIAESRCVNWSGDGTI
jgi:hypothetical protein